MLKVSFYQSWASSECCSFQLFVSRGDYEKHTHTQKMGKGKRVGEGGSLVPLQLIIGWSHGEGEGPRATVSVEGERQREHKCARETAKEDK